MSSIPLLAAPLAILIHVGTVVPAAFLGAWLFARPKGTRAHRLLGRVWVGLMVVTSLASLFIHEARLIGPFSPIHILSIVTLVTSWYAVRAARRRNIPAHRSAIGTMYFGGIVVAGAFTFLPGRLMNESVFAAGGLTDTIAAILLVAGFTYAGWLSGREMIAPMRMRRRERTSPAGVHRLG